MNVEMTKRCGKCLMKMRQEAGLTQTELAQRLDAPQSFISKTETGERALKIYEQFGYADALGISIHDFIRYLQNDIRGM